MGVFASFNKMRDNYIVRIFLFSCLEQLFKQFEIIVINIKVDSYIIAQGCNQVPVPLAPGTVITPTTKQFNGQNLAGLPLPKAAD